MERSILEIVKEDILEMLGRQKEPIPLSIIKPEIKVSPVFISKAIKELEKEKLIEIKKELVFLSELGFKKAQDIIKKHSVIENYFKEIKEEKNAWELASILEHYVSMEVIDNIKKLSTFKKESIILTEAKEKKGLITDIVFDIKLFERIVSMGIFPGEKIEILNKIPNGIVVKVGNKKFALANEIAEGIKVLK